MASESTSHSRDALNRSLGATQNLALVPLLVVPPAGLVEPMPVEQSNLFEHRLLDHLVRDLEEARES
jgi:hypothetical protein